MYVNCSVVSKSLRPRGLYPARLISSWDSPGKNTGIGCHFILQGIFPTHGLNPSLPTLQADSLLSEPWSIKLQPTLDYSSLSHILVCLGVRRSLDSF